MPQGRIFDMRSLRLETAGGKSLSCQFKTLATWPDQSAKWVSSTFVAPANTNDLYLTEAGDTSSQSREANSTLTFKPDSGGNVGQFEYADTESSLRLEVKDENERDVVVQLQAVEEPTYGPLIHEFVLSGTVMCGQGQLTASLTVELWHEHALARIQLTIRNPNKAKHPGGKWILGDAGSVLLRKCSLKVTPPDGQQATIWTGETNSSVQAKDVRIYQDSSGGENWKSPVHLDRHRKIPRSIQGFRLTADGTVAEGRRASPQIRVTCEKFAVSAAVPDFWQNFPSALAGNGRIEIALLPDDAEEIHEIQGGEQKTFDTWLSFNTRFSQDAAPLDWVHQQAIATPGPAWITETAAIPYLTSAADDPCEHFARYMQEALEGDNNFFEKRERLDEFGWRNFGDLYADHEDVFFDGPDPVVSHYNNQYDAVGGFGSQFLRTGDSRWYQLFADLASHVIDIDLYHTDDDRSVYNNGLFWHTDHYTSADLSTHRTFPDLPGVAGGGPSAEHLYSYGLLLFHYLTGDKRAADAVIKMAEFVIAADDGSQNVFRWIDTGRTGAATWSGSMDYHGPGRGGGNSIDALLNAFELTGDAKYKDKVEELIRRCVHPTENLDALDLLNVEERWFYMVFLKSICKYLDAKAAYSDFDSMFSYAREALLHYLRWAIANEYYYLDRPEILEYPTETWAAQELRKAEVFLGGARFAAESERIKLLSTGIHFYERAITELTKFDTRHLTRPLVLAAQFGWRRQSLRDAAPWDLSPTSFEDSPFPTQETFVRQKTRVKQKLKLIAFVGAVATSTAIISLVTG